jgi:hypothetical protein
MQLRRRSVPLFLTLTLLSGPIATSLSHGQSKGPAGFVDWTKESGVAEIVQKHYEIEPKLWLSGMTLVDVDGDGTLDLLIGGHGYIGSAGRNDGKGHFTWVDPKNEAGNKRFPLAQLPYPGGEIRLVHDFDEDGKLDALGAYGDGMGVAYLNASKPGDWSFKKSEPGFIPFSRSVAVADLNRDGIVDYMVNLEGRGNTKGALFLGKGAGKFERGDTLDLLAEGVGIPVDLHGNGFLDLLVTQRGYNPTRRKILKNDGKMNFSDVTTEAGLDPTAGSIHGVGDVNLDGHMDLICVEGREIVIYLNDGKGKFTKAPPVEGLDKARGKFSTTNWGGAIVADFDNDGLPDILINGRGALYLLKGHGDGRFTYVNDQWGLPSSISPAVDEGACFGDIDNDGKLDIITCASRGPGGKERGVAVYRNQLPDQHWLRVQLEGVKGNASAISAKIRLFPTGTPEGERKLCGYEQVSLWGRQSFHNYYSAAKTERHFGLGKREQVDVEVEFYPSGKKVTQRNVPANRTVLVSER